MVSHIQGVLEKLRGTIGEVKNVQSTLKDKFKNILDYLDTKKDKDLFEAIIAKITSIKTVVSLKGTKFKGSVRGHKAELNSNLDKFQKNAIQPSDCKNR